VEQKLETRHKSWLWVLRHSEKMKRRVSFLGGGILAGLSAYVFALLTDRAQSTFKALSLDRPEIAWVLAPIGFAFSAYITAKWLPNAKGSGIPQCIAAMKTKDDKIRQQLLSLKIAFGKVMLTVVGLACGASIGREGPTVQVGASIMSALGSIVRVPQNTLILAGSSAGIAAAFNAPLAGIVFAIEELSRSFESKTSGLIITSTIVAGITATTLAGNYAYFGYASGQIGSVIDWIALVVTAVAGGLFGGGFSRLVIEFGKRSAWQGFLRVKKHPVIFATTCGLIVGLCGFLSGGAAYGTGYQEAYKVIHGDGSLPLFYVPLKMIATFVSSISGIPGGLFAPSLSVGAGLGSLVAESFEASSIPQFALLGMAAYLTGVVQSPITSVVIMAEMTDNHAMVVPLLATALIANWMSKEVCPKSLYHSLAENFATPKAKAENVAA
jgi:H+/Cl- antiporter ClcA